MHDRVKKSASRVSTPGVCAGLDNGCSDAMCLNDSQGETLAFLEKSVTSALLGPILTYLPVVQRVDVVGVLQVTGAAVTHFT
jgi:hypothetical protein